LTEDFEFLWEYPTISEIGLGRKPKALEHQYPADLGEDFLEETRHLPAVHKANFEKSEQKPLELLNSRTIAKC